MTEYLLELGLLGVVVVALCSYSYVRWKYKRVSLDDASKTPVDYLWQILYPLYFIVLFALVTGGFEGLVLALIATLAFTFVWFMFLDAVISQEAAEQFFER